MFADVHSHVLYGIDDGARDVAETKRCLKKMHQSGVTHLAFTPHYYPHHRSVDSFLKRRENAFQTVKELPEAKDFTFSLGAEVYLGETLFNNEDLLPLCYEGTHCMLTELEYNSCFTDATKYRLLRLIEEYRITPVLAHIDRFPFLWKNTDLLEQLKQMGCLFQMNLSALQGFFSRRRAIKLYERGYLNFLGEDAHRSVLSAEEKEQILTRTERLYKGFSEKLSAEAVTKLFGSR